MDDVVNRNVDCFVDFIVKEDCYNPFESCGMHCVGCGCCSENPLERAKARFALHERLLDENIHFDLFSDDPELRALQKKNIETNIAWNTEQIAVYKNIISNIDDYYSAPTVIEAEVKEDGK